MPERQELAPNDFEVVPRDQEWLLAASFLSDVCTGLGDVSRARVLYDHQLSYAGRVASDVYEGSAGAVDRALGILAVMLGREREAIAHLEAAIELNERTGAKPWAAYARVDLADVLEAGDRPSEAEALRARAAETAASLGMRRLSERICRAADYSAENRSDGFAPSAPSSWA